MLQDKVEKEKVESRDTEVEVEHILLPSTSRNGEEEAQDRDESPNEEKVTEQPQEAQDLQNYSLARDRQRR